MIDLLNCPFCGCKPELKVRNGVIVSGEKLTLVASVECISCGAEGPSKGCSSERYRYIDQLPNDAVRAWNSRVI